MADSIQTQTMATAGVPTTGMAMEIDKMMMMTASQRKIFERKWYDNNFFDDGYHFRYLSRTTGKIVDLTERGSINMPERAIPKASRQIRGIANLMKAADPTPVVYPSNVTKANYPNPQEYQQAVQLAKMIAQRIGQYLQEEWKTQELQDKLTHMILLAAKNSVAYLQIWKDYSTEKICTEVFDAFDIYLLGNLNDIQKSPFLVKAFPEVIANIKSNPMFDKDQVLKISPDNKYASSEIKQAYMMSRFGTGTTSDYGATLILKEAFIKEYLNEINYPQVAASLKQAMEQKKMGDCVIRHVFAAGGVWLRDEYINMDEYPFIDFRFEPGPIYQTSLIERFIPANKSLDIVMSRIEKWINTMVTGVYQKRKGENMSINNIPGGQVIEYTATPLTQMNMANPPPIVGEFIGFLQRIIEEQGASTSALNQLPAGVKSGVAIENVKSTEYANLKIPTDQLKKTIRRVSKKIIEIRSEFVQPETIYRLNDKKEPDYFDIIGKKGVDVRKQLGMDVPSAIPVSGDMKIDIEIESGMGFTIEGKKQTMQQIIEFMIRMAQMGLLTTDAIKVVLNKFLEIYQFGSTQEFMEALDSGQQTAPLTEDQITQMKIAVVEAMKDAGVVGTNPEEDITKAKIGTVEALKDTGMLNKAQGQNTAKSPSESISFKDLPPEGQVQLAAQAGIQITPQQVQQHQDSQMQKQIITNSIKGGQNAQDRNKPKNN